MWEPGALLLHATLIGAGATLFMDLWATLQRTVFGVPSLDYALVGRWLGYFPRGKFAHAPITAAQPIRGEAALGWVAHYAIGIIFAAVLLAIWGVDWACDPSLAPALIVGLATVAAPFLILQPAFGAGIAASRAPRPDIARLRSVVAHISFGIGLYVVALAISSLNLP